MIIVGIEETTDSRHPETRIVRLRSEAAARKWLAQGGGYAWPGAADDSLPPGQQNFHGRLREAYILRPYYRLPGRDVEARMGYPHYRPRAAVEADFYRRDAVERIAEGDGRA